MSCAAGRPLSVGEISGEAHIPRSTAARLVGNLVQQRYLARESDGVVLGMRLFELGARATVPRRIASAAAPVVHDLAQRTGERIGVWVQQGTDMMSLTAVPGRLPMLPTRAGMRSPALTTASGKAYLAFCEDRTWSPA
jgi:IclR family acetate operon transcriptional repressor